MGFPGGKGRHYPRIIALMPPHDVYIEAFAGAAAVARHKKPAARTILIERDDRASAWLRSWMPSTWDLVSKDAVRYLAEYPFAGNELVYCDPPYLPTTRRSRRAMYRHDFTELDHRRFLALIRNMPCRVLVSGYPSRIYAKALQGWNETSFEVNTRAGNATEVIWFNFPKPDRLHDERYIGASFRERQNVRRRLSNIRNRLDRLSRHEQIVLYDWLRTRLDGSDQCVSNLKC
jgi:DNA adenine methylase